MKKLVLIIPFLAAISFSAQAQDEIVDVAVEIKKPGMEQKQGKRAIRRLVAEYMLEKGDITVEELEIQKQERQATRAELRALRESGDEEALAELLDEVRVERAARREEFRAYIAAHEDLAEAVKAKRAEIRQLRRERRQAMTSEDS